MQSSNIPSKFLAIWAHAAATGYIRAIPATAPTPTSSDAPAGLDVGFPPLTFTPESAGGIPPNGQDFNGILNWLSAWAQWQCAGAPVYYDSAFSSAIGGYPKGARITSASNPAVIWTSTVENNTSNPDAGGAGWATTPAISYADNTTAGTYTVTVPAWATHADVHIIGGGGGGAGSASGFSGGGGGAGGYVFGTVAVTPGATLTAVVGAGGAGISGSGTAAAGGTSSLTGIGSATGGGGGAGGSPSSAGGPGGTGTGTGLRIQAGGYGGDGNALNAGNAGGNGASGPFGGQGRAGAGGGLAGVASGAGGGGAYNASGAGGAGAPGAVLIRWLP